MDSAKRKKTQSQQKKYYPFSSSNFSSQEENYFYSPKNYDLSEKSHKTKTEKHFHGEQLEKGSKKRLWIKILAGIFLLAVFLFLSGGIYFVWKISSVSQKITIENTENQESASLIKNVRSIISPITNSQENLKTLAGESEGRINILLLGIAGEKNPGRNLTDTIMIMSLDTDSRKVALLSLPRDLYANIPGTSRWTKINSIYQYGLSNNLGIDPIKESVENITDLKIHYFLVMDFEGFKKIIDDIGGINVSVEKDIYDPRYPGPNYSYETFEIKKGLHNMDGETALKYARERHSDPEGDFGRAKRQQKVIQAAKNKIFSLKTFLNVFTFNKLLNTLENNIKTNIQLDEIESFIALSQKVDSQNIANAVVDAWKKDSLLKVSHVYYENTRVFILVPRVGNYSEIYDLARNIFDIDVIRRRQTEIEKEESSVAIINQSTDYNLAYKIKSLLEEDLEFKKVAILENTNNQTRNQSSVFDLASGKKPFSLDEIIKKLPAKFGNNNDSDIINIENDYDFLILIGEDLREIYKFGEDSIEDLNNAEYDQIHLDLLNDNN